MSFDKIKKRDGSIVKFDQQKITDAIWEAAQAVGGTNRDLSKKLSDEAVELLGKRVGEGIPTVEQIQDCVEKTLVENGHYKTAKAYILYRSKHEELRKFHELMSDVSLVENYIKENDWRVKENSNMTYSLQGLNVHITDKIISKYWLDKIYPPEIRKTHNSALFHIHDLGTLGPYCVGWDLEDLLLSGFKGVRGKIQSKPANHFDVALLQIVNFLYTLQGEAAGAQAISNFDTYLAPFIRYDELSYEEVKQAMQKFLYNMNVPTRVGFQTPFTNITMDLKIPDYLEDTPVIVGGKRMEETYGEFQEEMNQLNRAFAEVMIKGDAKGRPFTFPIPTYNITEGFEWDNPVLDPIWRMTAKYGIPYFSNFINSDMKPDDARSMCPLGGDERVLIKSTRGRNLEYGKIRNIYEGNSNQEEYKIFSDGEFVKGRFNRFKDQEMIKVTLDNNHELKMSKEHLNFVMKEEDGEIEELKGKELEEGMYLPYSLNDYEGEGGEKDLGYFVGAYAGDGSFDGNTVVFSLNKDQEGTEERLRSISSQYFNAHCSTSEREGVKFLKIHSRAAVGICKDYVKGKRRDKHYRARLFDASKEFREGVIEGHYATDGGNRNRIYTSSERMVESLNMLAASLGTTTSIYEDDREDRLGEESNYAVLVYQLNRNNYGDIWFKHENKLWVRIKSIEDVPNTTAYCFEVKNGKPVFTVGTTGILTHNCRLRLDNRELRKRGGGLFGSNPLTGSIGVVTINLPRIAYLSKSEDGFYDRLEELMELAKKSLVIKRGVLEDFTEKGLYPYSKFYLRNMKESQGEYWKNHFSTIGLIGMNDALLNLKETDIASEEGRKFAEEVLNFMRKKIADFQEETRDIFNLEATPAEGSSYRLARNDRKDFPGIRIYNMEKHNDAEPIYTNSTQLPFGYTNDIFEALELQDPLQTKYTGGTVFHAWLGEKMPSLESTKKIVKKIAENYRLPYYTLTPTFSICPRHGYMSGEHKFCPKCEEEGQESKCEVYSRVVGYLRPTDQWNEGKQEEFKNRSDYYKKTVKAAAGE